MSVVLQKYFSFRFESSGARVVQRAGVAVTGVGGGRRGGGGGGVRSAAPRYWGLKPRSLLAAE